MTARGPVPRKPAVRDTCTIEVPVPVAPFQQLPMEAELKTSPNTVSKNAIVTSGNRPKRTPFMRYGRPAHRSGPGKDSG